MASLLEQIRESLVAFTRLRVPPALIGGLQGYINDPTRTRDRDDIRALLRARHETLDHEELREYFRLFEREDLLETLIDEARG